MNENPLVSIITIVFNGQQHIQKTIDSVAKQTYKRIEYIIVDGGSTDQTVDIIKQNESNVSKWISEKDRGIADAFNKGIQLAQGDIIGLVNSDDWLEADAVEKVVANIGDADIIYGEAQFWLDEKPVSKTKGDHLKIRLGMTVSHPASFVRRSVYQNYGGFKLDYKVAMDYDLFLRFFHKGVKFKKLDAIITNMRRGGISDRRWLLGIQEEVTIKNEYYNSIANIYFFLRQYFIFSIKSFLRRLGYHS